MKGLFKKLTNLLLVLTTLFNTVASPLTVLAASQSPNKGDMKLEENGEVLQYGTEIGDSIVTTGGSLTNQGDVKITKKVIKKTDTGLYTVEITVEGVDYQDEQKTPIYTIFILDASDSMTRPNGIPWSKAKEAASSFSNTLITKYNQNKIALITFSNETMVNHNFGYFVNAGATRAFTDSDFSKTGNGTNYYKGLKPAYDLVNDIKTSNASAVVNVIFISDGAPSNWNCSSNCSASDIKGGNYPTLIKEKGATIYTLAYNLDSTSEAYSVLSGISSNGEVISTTSDDISTKLQSLATKITRESAANNAVVTDKIGNDFTFVDSNTNTTGVNENNGVVSYNIGEIKEGETYKFQFDIQVDVNTTNGWTFTNDTSNIKVTEDGKVLASIDKSAEVYWEANSYNYKVEYYYDGEHDITKDEVSSAVYGTNISNYVDKNITGYKLEKVTTTDNDQVIPLTVSDDESKNIIKVYYVKESYNYTVEYYYNGEIDNTLTETKSALFENEVSTYTDKVKPGYKFLSVATLENDKNLPLKIDTDTSKNVIRVYYVTDETQTKELKYTVEYYKNGVLQEIDTETYKTTVQLLESDNMTVDKSKINITDKYFGYKFEKIEPTIIPDTIENNGVIKVYYVIDEDNKKELNYTVEYYKDGVLQESDTEKFTTSIQVLGPNTLIIDKTKINTVDKYDGYKFVNTNPEVIPNTINTGSVIKVYYVKDTFNYSVEYYYDGVIDNSKTENNSALFKSEITTYTDKVKTGYKLEKVETTEVKNNTLPLIISSDASKNIIKVYYVKDSYGYKVEYYYDGQLDDSKTYTSKAEYMSEVTTYPTQEKKGFAFSKTENLPLTIGVDTTKNVIKVYYVSNIYDYTIYHVEKDNENNVLEQEKGSSNFGSVIDVNSKEFEGFTYDSQDKETIVIDTENNVAYVYYTRNVYKYTVEYYKENLDGEYEIVEEDTTVYRNVLFESEVIYEIKEYDDYTYDEAKLENFVALVPANNDLVVRLYYSLNDGKAIIHYVVKVEDRYIPFNDYARDEFGNKTPDFKDVELEDDILTGKIGKEFTTIYREVIEYNFIGIYEGNILENSDLVKVDEKELTSTFEGIEKEYTYVYEMPLGDGYEELPPQTGVEMTMDYVSYILLIGVVYILRKYFKLISFE